MAFIHCHHASVLMFSSDYDHKCLSHYRCYQLLVSFKIYLSLLRIQYQYLYVRVCLPLYIFNFRRVRILDTPNWQRMTWD